MNDLITIKFRIIAAVLYAMFAIPIGLTTIVFPWLLIIGGEIKSITETILFYFFFLSLPSVMIWPIISWVLWLTTKAIHPFVDLAGRDVLNYTLNNLIAVVSFVFVFAATSGILYKVKYFNIISMTILNTMIAVYVFTAIVAGVFAFKGYHFKNSLIHPFV